MKLFSQEAESGLEFWSFHSQSYTHLPLLAMMKFWKTVSNILEHTRVECFSTLVAYQKHLCISTNPDVWLPTLEILT